MLLQSNGIKQTSGAEKTRAETEARLSAEKVLAELQAQKLEEAAAQCGASQTGESSVHLEYNLSAERPQIKLGLRSLLWETPADKAGNHCSHLFLLPLFNFIKDEAGLEISEMKQKIVEDGRQPRASYMAPRPPVPSISTKLLNLSATCNQELMYQCV
ncbi:macoilin-1-like protein [Lates japonicus]|uniref:Macoilin-1-like protein n=1 Tax=Lates japonicus TaxID=270547 RepID=A0AAD3NAT9_LATJO|nr:macoilin-1-like protein [Lates japonicus]